MKDAVEGILVYVKKKRRYGVECDGRLVGVIRSGTIPMEILVDEHWIIGCIDRNILNKWYIACTPYYGDLNGVKVRISSVFLDKLKNDRKEQNDYGSND